MVPNSNFCISTVYVSERSPVPTYFAYVSVKDDDFDINGFVDLEIEKILSVKIPETSSSSTTDQYNNVFDAFVLNKNGFLGVNQKLDRENLDKYRITLKACDQGKEQL